jgi:hypothetical protein
VAEVTGTTCPSWCTRDHTDGIRVHASKYRWDLGPSLALLQGLGEPVLCFDGAHIRLCDAGALAGTMRRLGREDIASAITETAALATGTAAGA